MAGHVPYLSGPEGHLGVLVAAEGGELLKVPGKVVSEFAVVVLEVLYQLHYELVKQTLGYDMNWWNKHWVTIWTGETNTGLRYELVKQTLGYDMNWWNKHWITIWTGETNTGLQYELVKQTLGYDMNWWNKHWVTNTGDTGVRATFMR